MEKEQTKLLHQVSKGKAVIETSEPEGTQGKGKTKIPIIKWLNKALQEEEEHILLNEELDPEDGIALEVNEEEYWLNKLNDHLEKLLEK